MRRFLLSSFVILSFVFYALWEQQNGPKKSIQTSLVAPPASQTQTNSSYKDGQYTGDLVDAFYGNVQVKATIQNGKITDVSFLDYPQDRQHSIEINSQATPMLTQEAIQAQTAKVDIISGATATSQAFIQSLQSALNQAKG